MAHLRSPMPETHIPHPMPKGAVRSSCTKLHKDLVQTKPDKTAANGAGRGDAHQTVKKLQQDAGHNRPPYWEESPIVLAGARRPNQRGLRGLRSAITTAAPRARWGTAAAGTTGPPGTRRLEMTTAAGPSLKNPRRTPVIPGSSPEIAATSKLNTSFPWPMEEK